MEIPSKAKRILPGDIRCVDPPLIDENDHLYDRTRGSFIGAAVGDALGAHVEFRPHDYLKENPVKEMHGGGTWGLQKGQWTDDTSMALCLASSLIKKNEFDLYNQMVHFKWWYLDGYLSSTGHCFDIGQSTVQSIQKFVHQQRSLKRKFRCRNDDETDLLSQISAQKSSFNIFCGDGNGAGNGALMRLAPIPLYFHSNPELAVLYAEMHTRLTHCHVKAIDASKYFSALILETLRGSSKEDLLSEQFLPKHSQWFHENTFDDDIRRIANGSFKKPNGYDGGIRGKGFVVNALEAALWAFWSTTNFRDGALAAVNLGDDTDTTAAIYGQLAGTYYGYKGLPLEWMKDLYAKDFLDCISKWIYYSSKQSGRKSLFIERSNQNENEREKEKEEDSSNSEKSFHSNEKHLRTVPSTSQTLYQNKNEKYRFYPE